MKICIIVDDYLPHSIKIAAKMMHELAIEFKMMGHEVIVITPGIGIKNHYEMYTLDAIKVYKFRSGSIKNTGKIKRAINETLLSFNAWRFLKNVFINNPHDIIVYYSPSIFRGLLVRKLKNLWNAPSYLILRDFFPQWVIDNGMLKKNSIITKYFQFFESLNYDVANTIGIQSPQNIIEFKKFNPLRTNIELLYNWATDNAEIAQNYPYRTMLKLENKIVFFYGGNIGHAQDMKNILILARNLINYTEAHFVLVGAGDEVELVRETILKESLTNLTLLEPVTQEEFKKMLSEFDVGLFSFHKDHSTHNFPGKVLGYMVQSMPILGCVNPGNDLKVVVEEANAGFVTISGEYICMKENAMKLLNKTIRNEMGANAKKLLKEPERSG